ncbi:glycosyltransferase [Actinomyces slackii]|uniref:Poly-beta-1,6-N-acetyl-D-glucosamine synthase n=1 Tax=Actinomyces slackii TaxID=52774 RepID=A0A3S5EMB1_9ACTO|nr:glycosyltransferase family 2 protein [Actinomyces slackii]VEG75400.1 Poly-beta-1,6-N-acetyl-D-glucosamine synthase [Actinomyces slackii]
MSWSFGVFVVLVCVLMLFACLAIKLCFKRGLDLTPSRTPRRQALRTTRRRVTTPEHAQEFADRTKLPRALPAPSVFCPLLIIVVIGLGLWLYWRIAVTLRDTIDPWLIWTFNIVFAAVAAQLLIAFFERRIVGEEHDHRTAVLVPLYNEDPEVVRSMLEALLVQSAPPSEIHVVDDGSTQGAYPEVRKWFHAEAINRGIHVTWQRTPNRGKRHAQAQAFRQIRRADLFVTVDSDSMLDAEALKEITSPFSDPSIMSVAGIILATNNRTNLLARITDMIFVGQQLTDRSSMSRLGTVMVNSGGLAAYRYSILADNIEIYMNENYVGRHVEFSDDSMLTLFAMLRGRTVQQPSAFAFAWMPDRFSHHYRQQVRWFRGSFIRGLWRIRFLPILSWGWWRQMLGWAQLWVVSSVFVYLAVWRPLFTDYGIPIEVLLVPILIGLAQNARYVSVWRSDVSDRARRLSLLLSPLATLWTTFLLRPLRLWGMVTSTKMGWNTRQSVEVTTQAASA